MLNFLKKEVNYTRTENGALTYRSTYSECLDLFGTIGAVRRESDDEIIRRFVPAFAENADLAMKTLFFARDVRGGLGERKVFRTIIKYLADTNMSVVVKNIPYIAEYGRWDDLLVLMGTPCEKKAVECIKTQLEKDMFALEKGGNVSLLGKWLPSVNTSNAETVYNAKKIASALGMNDMQYRKMLAKLRKEIKIIENNLRTRDYSFEYEKQPSKALFKYRNAFCRNDGERYAQYLASAAKGEAKMNTGTLYPYEIISPFFERMVNESETASIDVTWNAQKDYTNGENALVVMDGSGSMYGQTNPEPITVAMSLAIYFAERNKGAFHNYFITFSRTPKLVEIKGKNILEKVQYCSKYNEVANTNLYSVFELILKTSVKYNVPQSEIPSTLYIISDMEFDWCIEGGDVTNFEAAKRLFESYGYELPKVVFWNVASRNIQQPVTQNEQGVALVSGASPRVFSMIAEGKLSAYEYMLEVLESERYAPITA